MTQNPWPITDGLNPVKTNLVPMSLQAGTGAMDEDHDSDLVRALVMHSIPRRNWNGWFVSPEPHFLPHSVHLGPSLIFCWFEGNMDGSVKNAATLAR